MAHRGRGSSHPQRLPSPPGPGQAERPGWAGAAEQAGSPRLERSLWWLGPAFELLIHGPSAHLPASGVALILMHRLARACPQGLPLLRSLLGRLKEDAFLSPKRWHMTRKA